MAGKIDLEVYRKIQVLLSNADISTLKQVDKLLSKRTNSIKMKKISLNNGNTWKSYDELTRSDWDVIEEIWDAVVSCMDDDAREEVHDELAPCTNKQFLKRYLEIAPFDLCIG